MKADTKAPAYLVRSLYRQPGYERVTAFPLERELSTLLVKLDGLGMLHGSALLAWLHTVHDALAVTNKRYPFLAYGTDWLAFGHLAIAAAFLGLLDRSGAQQMAYHVGTHHVRGGRASSVRGRSDTRYSALLAIHRLELWCDWGYSADYLPPLRPAA